MMMIMMIDLIKAKRVVVKWTFPSESSGIFILTDDNGDDDKDDEGDEKDDNGDDDAEYVDDQVEE